MKIYILLRHFCGVEFYSLDKSEIIDLYNKITDFGKKDSATIYAVDVEKALNGENIKNLYKHLIDFCTEKNEVQM